MKRVSKLFAMLIAAVGTMVFSACDTSTDGENFYVSYGEVVGTSESYTIKTDAGNTLHIVENLLPTFPVEDGMRVRVNFTIQEQSGSDLNVRLNAIEKVLSKEPVYSSQLTPEELEELGNDPIYVKNAWFGGKYLNIDFAVLRFDPQLAGEELRHGENGHVFHLCEYYRRPPCHQGGLSQENALLCVPDAG